MSFRKIGVIAGLDPAIHQLKAGRVIVRMDAQGKPAHDEQFCCSRRENLIMSGIV